MADDLTQLTPGELAAGWDRLPAEVLAFRRSERQGIEDAGGCPQHDQLAAFVVPGDECCCTDGLGNLRTAEITTWTTSGPTQWPPPESRPARTPRLPVGARALPHTGNDPEVHDRIMRDLRAADKRQEDRERIAQRARVLRLRRLNGFYGKVARRPQPARRPGRARRPNRRRSATARRSSRAGPSDEPGPGDAGPDHHVVDPPCAISAPAGADWPPAELAQLLDGVACARARLLEGASAAIAACESGSERLAADAALCAVLDASDALTYAVGEQP